MSDQHNDETGPRKVKATESDVAIASRLLDQEVGGDPTLFKQAVAAGGLGAITPERIAQVRKELDAKAQAEENARWQATPEGRKVAARLQLLRDEQEAEDAKAARALLAKDQRYDGVELTDAEAIKEAGFANDDAPPAYVPGTAQTPAVEELSRTWFRLTGQQRRQFAVENGIAQADFERIGNLKANQQSPNIFG